MNSQWIEIDDEVIATIKGQAEPLADSPNDVLRRLLGLEVGERPSCAMLPAPERPTASRGARVRTRVPQGSVLPMEEYRLPLLRTLSQLGGSGHVAAIQTEMESMLGDRLTDPDRQRLQSGEIRWLNRLGFARLEAIDRGHMRSGSRRGIWELSEAGVEELARLEALSEEEGG